ncbi:response regulator [Azospirillum sp. SYSU D00513]|uniref:response regulator n=1 Tax=Azospirillum sp. SYSU D00513 TaxID=2812561 RepID=UPI001A9739CE|nr:response regulator [Azospirillum sp. SYSU D00513]
MYSPAPAGPLGGLWDGAPPPDVNILVVDDDARNLMAVRETLAGLGANLVLASSGDEALKHLLSRDFALILLDVHMPGMDGYELAEMIRKREKCRHIPIIFLTAINKDQFQVFRGYSAGAVDYMFKPVDPQVLTCKVAVFVELYRKTEEIKRQAEAKQQLLAENYRVNLEKLQAERALRQAEERQALILRSLPIALYTADLTPGQPFRFLSGNVEALFGYPPERFVDGTMLWEEGLHPDDRARVLAQMAALPEAGSCTTEYRWRCADGSYRHLLDQAVAIPGEDGTARELFGTILDVTETRMMQEQLLQAQKMEVVGQLTGGIAHDFNNMLMVVIGSLERLLQSLRDGKAPDPKTASRRADMALQAALRCSDLTRRLLTFARRQNLHPEPVNLNALVLGMGELFERTLGGNVEVRTDCAAESWPALVDRSQAESVLLNLVINARDAMPRGGTLAIRTANIRLEEPLTSHGMTAGPGDYVVLSVADNGCGMAPEVLERAFEPFFTTKETGKGTGLGLSMIYGFLKQTGGLVRIDSAVGSGTSFHLYLPRAAEAPAAPPPAGEGDPLTALRGSGETVLVVDDDHDVRRVTVQTLHELGYRTLEAATGPDALTVIRTAPRVDLLFSDIVMPGGMDGRDLAREAVRLQPHLRVLFASGYANGGPATGGAGDGADLSSIEMLLKPYRDHELARALRRTLDLATPPPVEA